MKDLSGFIYVLYDGYSSYCKIGLTKTSGSRQKAVMGSYSRPLFHVLDASVSNRYEAETMCHRHFKEYRTNGEWFNVRLEDVIQFIHDHVEWDVLEFCCMASLGKYIVDCKRNKLNF